MESTGNTKNLTIRLTYYQLQSLSEITADIGQAIFASTIIPFAFELDRIKPWVVLLGLITAAICWTVSVYLSGKMS